MTSIDENVAELKELLEELDPDMVVSRGLVQTVINGMQKSDFESVLALVGALVSAVVQLEVKVNVLIEVATPKS
jgi:hypothetical protein